MSNDKIDPNKKDATISSADDLVKPANTELTEEELNRVTGGGKAAKTQKEYLVIKMSDVSIT
jgi:bacteriocin-like protein